MRFGISGMQFAGLVGTAGSAADAAARVAAFDHADHVRALADQGFDAIELAGDLTFFFPQAFAPLAIERLAALKEERRLDYTVHLPLWSVEPSTPLDPVRRGSVAAVVETIRATWPLQPASYVLHATNALASEFYRRRLPEPANAYVLGTFQHNARRSLETILAETGIPSRRLAPETVEFPLDLTLELVNEFDLGVCFDTGHVLVGYSGPFDFFDALERCLPHLAQVHLHDASSQGPERRVRYGEDHKPLGTRDLDVAGFLDHLTEAGFAGPLVFELPVDQALASLDVVRALRPEVLAPLEAGAPRA